MKINVIGRKVSLRNNFKEMAERKLSKFDRIFDEDAEATVTATVERNCQRVEITIRQRGMIYRAEDTANEMNEALDHAISALGRQIRRNKTRLEKAKKMAPGIEFSEDYGIVELLVPKSWVGKTIRELDVRNAFHVNIITMSRTSPWTLCAPSDSLWRS